MNAILAIIADGRQAIVDIDIEAGRNTLFSHLLYNFIIIPSTTALSNPFLIGSRRWGTLAHQNHASGEENGSIMGGCLCSCVQLAKSLLRGSFLFPPECIGVKLLTLIMSKFIKFFGTPCFKM